MDRLLDEAGCGPTYLQMAPVAKAVQRCIRLGQEMDRFHVHAWVIMPNHVHLLMTPFSEMSQLPGSLKPANARAANVIVRRTGQPFWQDESYDRLVRDEQEFRRVHRYIENNPVLAGLAATAEEYAWSSAWRPEGPDRPLPSL